MIWIVILIEHIILATKFVYSVAIEDAPDWVQRSRDGIAAMKYVCTSATVPSSALFFNVH
jgi:hypothetical protein